MKRYRMTFLHVWPALWLISFLLCACVDDTNGFSSSFEGDTETPGRLDGDGDSPPNNEVVKTHTASTHEVSPWAIAVVGTDYYSTSISIIARESQSLFRENVVHSGSVSSGLSVALSGDVVFPRTHNHKNWIVLLDRYPNSVLTFVDPNDFNVIGQLSVATGFASNPHDFLWLEENKAYVTRYEKNPTSGTQSYDGGDDILIVDPIAREITGRIDLSSYADTDSNPDLQSRPARMAYADGVVWTTLDHLNSTFEEAGEGRIVGIDTATDTVTELIRLEDVTNCTGIEYVAKKNSLYVSCCGLFVSGIESQREHSAIVRIDLNGDEPEPSVLRAADDDRGRPFGFDTDTVEDRWLLATRFGDLEQDIPDVLVAIDLETGEETVVHTASSAYGLGGFLADAVTGTIYVGEADPSNPGIHLYHAGEDEFESAGVIDSHPKVGLPPRHIRFY